MTTKPIIAIDGPSGSGKSTLAKALSQKLHYYPIDSGAIYRSIAFWGQGQELPEMVRQLANFSYEERYDGHNKRYFVNGTDVTEELRTEWISKKASLIAKDITIRQTVNALQKTLAEHCGDRYKGIVAEGRDAATIVFPQAKYKFYLTADVRVRAQRRQKELKAAHTDQEILEEIQARDARDQQREHGPLKQAKDAILIDTTTLRPEQTVKRVQRILTKKPQRIKPPLGYRFLSGFSYYALRLFYKLRARGLNNYPRSGALIAANHVSFLDPLAIGAVVPGHLCSIAAEWLFRNRFIAKILKKMGTMPTSRGAPFGKAAFKLALEQLEAGRSILIFPEGTRSRTGKLLEFKRGVSVIASQANCSIVPTYVDGAYEIWPPGKLLPRFRGRLTVHFGQPLIWSDYAEKYPSIKEAQQHLLEDLRARVLQLRDDAKALS